MTERRTLRRYELSFHARIRLHDTSLWSKGKTRDISAQGVYLQAQQSIPVGSHVEMYFALPEKCTRGTKVFIYACGHIVRLEDQRREQEAIGVAAVIDRYDFTRGSHWPTDHGEGFVVA